MNFHRRRDCVISYVVKITCVCNVLLYMKRDEETEIEIKWKTD
jgi:hypothetical protein